jgi:GTP-binding protein
MPLDAPVITKVFLSSMRDMLADKARIEVRGGAGGDGSVSFRREAHVPKGGPDGGDGGHGGDVVLRCEDNLRDLQFFKRTGHFRAARGGHGMGALKHGADGETLVVNVPPGTEVRRWDGARYDLVTPGQEVRIARGGAGGRGNKTFATATRQAPRLAEKGLPGEEGEVELQLKLLADVGLVGLPNAGKSSLIARLTRAKPKVADYPFTTLEPNLGVLEADDRALVVADIPGLIEGASAGAGLGHDFLAHVERCRVLVHVVDVAPVDGSDPRDNYALVEGELAAHSPELAALPRLIALSKVDLAPNSSTGGWGSEAVLTSAATGRGLDELRRLLLRLVPAREPAAPRESDVAEFRVFKPAAGRAYAVEKTGAGEFRVTGDAVERLIARFDLENEEAQALVERRLARMGVIAALQRAGFTPGDDVEIGGIVFELDPS